MDQLDLLWEYQEIDSKIEKAEFEKKNSNTRQKLVKIKNYLIDKQNTLHELNTEAENKKVKLEELDKAYDEFTAKYQEHKGKIKDKNDLTIEIIEECQKEADILKRGLEEDEKELLQFITEVDNLNKQLSTIRLQAANAKKDYDVLKAQYESEFKELQQKIKELKENRSELASKIDKSLIIKYKNIKAHKKTPIATIDNEKCSGCNMSLPSLVVHNVKDSKKIIECENCGRILYIP